MGFAPIAAFIHELRWSDLPPAVQQQARRCLLDTIGAAIGGRGTPVSAIVHDYAAAVYGGDVAMLWLDGRSVSPPGAALAGGMTIDSLDIHDGYNPVKGHAGAAVVPAVLATLGLGNPAVSGAELLTTLVLGYEVALRAGVALHATACDYHTSGAWNALGAAAVTARRLGLAAEPTHHALGAAEYHGPRSQMMRCIDFPTMVKDGSGWGAMTGVSAGLLAARGFTGAPAVTVTGTEVTDLWADLGRRWRIQEQYFKPHAVCRWAQPAIEAALKLQRRHRLAPEQVRTVRVASFHEATRLALRRPRATDEAQYSLPFPVAAALVHGRLGPRELSGPGLSDPAVLRLADGMELVEDEAYNARFPAQRFARVDIETRDGARFSSGDVAPTWEAEAPPSDEALQQKFAWLAQTQLTPDRAVRLADRLWHCAELPETTVLAQLLAAPP